MQSPGRLVHVGFKIVMSILDHEPAQWIAFLTRGVYLGGRELKYLDKGCDTVG